MENQTDKFNIHFMITLLSTYPKLTSLPFTFGCTKMSIIVPIGLLFCFLLKRNDDSAIKDTKTLKVPFLDLSSTSTRINMDLISS